MKTVQSTKVVDDYGTVIAGNEESYWIEVHPNDVGYMPADAEERFDSREEEKGSVYQGGVDIARNDGNGDAALHAAMVEDSSHGLASAFFYWDEENGTWWRVALADL